MADPKIETFEQFWDFYVGEHKKKSTRLLHFIGTTAAVSCLAAGLLTKRRWLLLVAPVCGYGPAWIGHFFVEKNKPASFKYPLWSLQADFVMWWKTLSGQMQAEVDRVVRQELEKERGETDDDAPRERASIQNEAVN
ncbi:MAG: DUF962 domain-containing protein [Labilithrix sp.]|nr:DUF962 domain-containing protein [Labilithrix sp.]MCW5837997.1 DUF962 domain-containing protein [Labilithrix sp.]